MPWLRIRGLPAPGLDVPKRRELLLKWRLELQSKPGWSEEQEAVNGFVLGRAQEIVQESLDRADRLRRENLEKKKAQQAKEREARRRSGAVV